MLFFLAMSHHQLGDSEEARRCLEKAENVFEQVAAGATRGNFGSTWPRWISVSIVCREAEALIPTAAASDHRP